MGGWGGGGSGNTTTNNVIPVGSTQVPGDTAISDPVLSEYFEALSVATGIETTILTHVVPPTPIQHVLRVEFGGKNIGVYKMYSDATVIAQEELWWTSGFSGSWSFKNPGGGGLPLTPGAIIRVKILHKSPAVGDFFARFQYIEVN